MPFSSPQRLRALYAKINEEFFEGVLPPCQLKWSRQLTQAAGNIDVKNRLMKLSVPLLFDSYELPDAQFEVCGVLCTLREAALYEILKHEMIHLWLHERGLPSGHTAAFRAKARSMGQPKIRHGIARPQPTSGWIYACGQCDAQLVRRRRFGRPVACAKCCKAHSGGAFDARFQLRGRRIGAPRLSERAKRSR